MDINSAVSSSSSIPVNDDLLDMNSILLSVTAEARKAHISSTVCDLTCICGVYALESKKFDGLRNQSTELAAWVKLNHPKSVAFYVVGDKVVSRQGGGKGKECGKLHINFANNEDLNSDMLASSDVDLGSRLVRCAGGDGKPCGISVLSFPEQVYIHSSVDRSEVGKTSMANVAKSVAASINEVCEKAVLLDNISVSESSTGDRVVSVRFHHVNDLRLLVSKESTFELWSKKVTIEVPNVADLCLCKGCNLRGHKFKDCPMYNGLVVRFVFKTAVSELARQKIMSIAKATTVYTGLFAGVKRPNHMVHCIYKSIEEVKVGLFEVVKAYDSVLARSPTLCDPKNKSNECHNCGETSHRGNMCPLVYSSNRRTLVDYSSVVGSVAPSGASHQHAASAKHIDHTRAAKGSDVSICFAWSSTGGCSRDKCPYAHPDNRKAELGTCYNLRDFGKCRFGERCKYKHPSAVPAAAPATAPSTPRAAPTATPSPSLSLSSSPAASQSDGMDDGFTAVGPGKRRRTIAEVKSNAQ